MTCIKSGWLSEYFNVATEGSVWKQKRTLISVKDLCPSCFWNIIVNLRPCGISLLIWAHCILPNVLEDMINTSELCINLLLYFSSWCFCFRGLDIKGEMTRYRAGLASAPIAGFMVTYNKHTLSLEDLGTLEEQNWLNDQVKTDEGFHSYRKAFLPPSHVFFPCSAF